MAKKKVKKTKKSLVKKKKFIFKKINQKKIDKVKENANLRRISGSSTDDKIEIKKIIKQAVEKKIYNIKDFVVYPKHGVG